MIFSGCKKEEVYRVVKINHFDGEVTVLRDEKMNAFEELSNSTEYIVEEKDKTKVMEEISKDCGIKTTGKGICFSIPIEATMGLDIK